MALESTAESNGTGNGNGTGGLHDDPLHMLLHEAEKFEKESRFPDALGKINSALAIDKDNARALVLAASCHVSLGTEDNDKEARSLYERAVAVEPEEGYDKYLGLAELTTGQEAINCFEKGLEIIKNERQRLLDDPKSFFPDLLLETLEEDPEELKSRSAEALLEVNARISSVLASIVEIYLVDLKEQPESLHKGLELITKGVEEFSEDPELWLLSAQFNLFTKEPNKSKEDLKKSVYYILNHCQHPENLKNIRPLEPERCYGLLQRIFEHCLSLKQFRLAKICLEELGQLTNLDDPRLCALYACYHRLSAIHHLRGASVYANRAIQAVESKVKACEAIQEDFKAKELSNEILQKTPKRLAPLLTGSTSAGENPSSESEGAAEAEGGGKNGGGNYHHLNQNLNLNLTGSLIGGAGENVDFEEEEESEYEDSDIDEENFDEHEGDQNMSSSSSEDSSEEEGDEEGDAEIIEEIKLEEEEEEDLNEVVEQAKALEKEGEK